MKNFIIGYIFSALSMLAIDAVWLTTMSQRFYKKHIGHLMAESPQLFAAGIFYAIYITGITVLVILPAVSGNKSLLSVFAMGALYGFAAYATYDLTNQATLKDWPVIVTIVDLLWGAVLSGAIACIGWFAVKYFA